VGSIPAGRAMYRSVTQLDRVPVFETGSRGFESCQTGHIYLCSSVVEHRVDNAVAGGSFPPTGTKNQRGYSSAGRATGLQPVGRRFDPVYLHQSLNSFIAQEYTPSGTDSSAGSVDVVRGHRRRELRTCPGNLVNCLQRPR